MRIGIEEVRGGAGLASVEAVKLRADLVLRILADGIAQLNASSMASASKPFAEVAEETVRIAAIRQIEGGAFFTKVYGGTLTPLYNQPELWPLFGYEGPSSALGGYANRGFSDIDWL